MARIVHPARGGVGGKGSGSSKAACGDMGILYSHIVFQPPSPPTYGGDNGVMYYRKLRDSEDDTTRSVDAVASTNSEQVADSDTYVYIEHPLIFLNTSKGSTIPAAYFGYPNSYFTILFSHVRPQPYFYPSILVSVPIPRTDICSFTPRTCPHPRRETAKIWA